MRPCAPRRLRKKAPGEDACLELQPVDARMAGQGPHGTST
jgi:hypothetical protein